MKIMKNSVFKVLGLAIFFSGLLCSAMLVTSEPETSVHYDPDDCRCYLGPDTWDYVDDAENVRDRDGIHWDACDMCEGPVGPGLNP